MPSSAPAGDSYCMDTFGKFVCTAISGTYAINTQTLIMSATATFEGQDVALFPLGLSSVYAFMSDGVPAPLADMQVHRIIFDLSHDQSTKESDVMFVAGGTYNCSIIGMYPNRITTAWHASSIERPITNLSTVTGADSGPNKRHRAVWRSGGRAGKATAECRGDAQTEAAKVPTDPLVPVAGNCC